MKTSRRIAVFGALGAAALLSFVVGIAVGTVSFSPMQIIKALFVDDGSAARLLIWNLRLPRVLTGGLVGICLALSGCILQGVMRNSLASPSTIGVSAGASFAGYLLLVAFPRYAYLLPIGTVIGALASALLIYVLAYKRGAGPMKIILAGMAVSALLGAASDIIKTVFADSLANASGFIVGGLNGSAWESLINVLPLSAVGIAACVFIPSRLNILALGDDAASALGLRTEPFRFFLIVISSLLAGSAICAAGLIGFVGLAVPHIARLIVGGDNRLLIPASALIGASLVTLCDTLGRVIMPPGEIPVGIILALIGAPFFLWLLRSRENGGM